MELVSGFFTSFLGAAAGGAVASVAFFYQRSEESKQKYRRVLFDLLGIYRILIVTKELTPTKYIEALGNVLAELGHPDFQQNKEFQEFIKPFVVPQLNEFHNQIVGLNEKDYEQAIQLIAPINPVLAQSLRANSLLKNILNITTKYWDKYLVELEKHGMSLHEIEHVSPMIEDGLVDHLLEDLKDDILKLAWLAGITDLIRTKKWLKARNIPLEETLKPFAEEMMLMFQKQE